ncbi:MAG: Rpn family recombination-promoting nuclease/putative transposase [Nostoc sp.]|uniref:Rpn family recombination-promoting nuclease/putative transposase n=1 Tax=Nostoc sp. TaxID=1180 RepID=UPI002FFA47E0
MIDHDRLFKELIATFFIKFLELFFSHVIAYLEPESLKFLDKEVFNDVTASEQYEADLVVQIRFREQKTFFLMHIENQSYPQADFGRRMFRYFARLFEKYALPVYPIVVFSYDALRTPKKNIYRMKFPDKNVLEFNYGVVQLNQLKVKWARVVKINIYYS